MKPKLKKRVFVAVLALALSVVMVNTSALAASTVNEVKEKSGNDGSIVVTVYDQDPGSEGTGGEASVSGNPVTDVGINALRIGSVVELTTTENTAVSTQVAFGLNEAICQVLGLTAEQAIASENGIYYFDPAVVQTALGSAPQADIENYLNDDQNAATNQITDSSGAATFSSLEYGLYLLAKSALPADATTDLAPFLVSVPMYVESDSGGTWQSTVYAYPKVRTAEIVVKKIVDDRDDYAYENGDIYANAGQTLEYTVTATIPAAATGNSDANEFTSFAISDTNTDGTLNIDESSVEVKLNGTTLAKDTQYAISLSNGVLTITLTDTATTGGLAALNSDLSQERTITVTYDAVVATNATFSTKLINTAKATYQREGMTDKANTDETEVDLYTYGIHLTKTLSDDAAITEEAISFELYKASSDGTLGDKVPVKHDDSGCYWVAATEEADSVVMHANTSGSLSLYGLEPGTYYLKETATMEGYALLAEPITIVIADVDGDGIAAATVNNVEAQVTDGTVSLTVENTKNETGFNLPQTGGAGTLLATAIGLGLLFTAVILLAVYRRKGQKNN